MSDETKEVVEVTQESEPKKKVKKPKSKARRIIEWVLTGIFFVLFGFFAAGKIDAMIHQKENYGESISFGYGSFVIVTDSMEPDYMVGSAIITYKEDLDNVYKRYQESLVDESITIDMAFMDIYSVKVKPIIHTELYDQTINTKRVMTHRLKEVIYKENVEYGQGKYTFIMAGINQSEHQSQAGQYQAFTENEYLGVVQANSKVLGGFYQFLSSPWGLLAFLLIPAMYLVITSIIDIFANMKDGDEEGDDNNNTPGSLDELSDKDRERLKKELLDEMLSKKGEN